MSDWQRVINACTDNGLEEPKDMLDVADRIEELADRAIKIANTSSEVETIYCDTKGVGSLPYFYLHGKAEDDNNYDVIGANSKALTSCLQANISYCEIVTENNETNAGLIVSGYDQLFGRMAGYIVYIADTFALGEALNKFKPNAYMLSSHIRLIKELAPETLEFINKWKNEKI